VIVFIAMLTTALLGMAALAIDLGYLMEVRSAMQNVADATALAAVSGLTSAAEDPEAEAKARAAYYASRNDVLSKSFHLVDSQIEFGSWDGDTETFEPTLGEWNAARVTLQRHAGTIKAEFPLFFASVLGIDRVRLEVQAVAAFGPRTMVLVLDRSRSMEYDTVDPNEPQPLTDVKEQAVEFVKKLDNYDVQGDYLGLVTYDEFARRDYELDDLSVNLGAIRTAIEDMQIEYDPDPYEWACTNIAHGIQEARLMIEEADSEDRSEGVKTIILLSDGIPNTRLPGRPGPDDSPNAPFTFDPCFYMGYHLPDGDPNAWTDEQRRFYGDRPRRDVTIETGALIPQDTVVYSISFGEEADTGLMAWIAEMTGGEHFLAEDAEALDEVFEQISERIPTVLVQ
jgi:hypothetical protein